MKTVQNPICSLKASKAFMIHTNQCNDFSIGFLFFVLLGSPLFNTTLPETGVRLLSPLAWLFNSMRIFNSNLKIYKERIEVNDFIHTPLMGEMFACNSERVQEKTLTDFDKLKREYKKEHFSATSLRVAEELKIK